MRDTNRHGDRHHVERMGGGHGRAGHRYRQPGISDSSGHRRRVPRRGWHLSRHFGNTFEGHLAGCSDHDVTDRWDDHLDHSSDNDDNHWWHCTGRGVTARFRVGWKLKASSLHRSRSRPLGADPPGASKPPSASSAGGSGPAVSRRHAGGARVASGTDSGVTLRRGAEGSGDYVSSEHGRSDGSWLRSSRRPRHWLRRWVGHQLIAILNVDQQGGHRSGHDSDVVPIRNDEVRLTSGAGLPATCGGVV